MCAGHCCSARCVAHEPDGKRAARSLPLTTSGQCAGDTQDGDALAVLRVLVSSFKLTGRATASVVQVALPWAALGLVASTAWQFGPRTVFGRALSAGCFPLLILVARISGGRRWRLWLSQSLAFCVPACTLLLLVNLLYSGTGYASTDPTERLCAALDSIAEFLRENAIATFLGLATLLISCRPTMPVAERKAFEVAMTAVLLATLSVIMTCALLFQVLSQLALEELHFHVLRERATSTQSGCLSRSLAPLNARPPGRRLATDIAHRCACSGSCLPELKVTPAEMKSEAPTLDS